MPRNPHGQPRIHRPAETGQTRRDREWRRIIVGAATTRGRHVVIYIERGAETTTLDDATIEHNYPIVVRPRANRRDDVAT